MIDHFQVEARRHFNCSLVFTLLVIPASMVLAFLIGSLAAIVFGLTKSTDLSEIYQKLTSLDEIIQYGALVNAFVVLSIGLYGSFVISAINDERLTAKEQLSIKDFVAFISAEEWQNYFKLAAIMALVHFITYPPLTSWFSKRINKGATYSELGDTYTFLIWSSGLLLLLKNFLAFFLAQLFIRSLYTGNLSLKGLRQYKTPLINGIFLSFAVQVGGEKLVQTINTYVIKGAFAMIPGISGNLLTAAIGACFLLVAGAYLNWGIAAAVCLPVRFFAEGGARYEAEQQTETT